MSDRIRIQPEHEILYPDGGGYTGFSIRVWNIEGKAIDTISVMHGWGGFHPDRILPDRKSNYAEYILEGRFFVYGHLIALFVETGAKAEMYKMSVDLNQKWTPIMDEIKEAENELFKQDDRQGIQYDEIITQGIEARVSSGYTMRHG